MLQNKMADAGIQDELAPVGIADSYDVLSCFIMGEDDLASYAGNGRLNTDDHPYLEYSPTMAYFYTAGSTADNLTSISDWRHSVWPYLSNPGEDAAGVQAALQQRFEDTPVWRFQPG